MIPSRVRQVLASREAGFSLESILIGVGLMALLAAIAIPTFLSQRNKAFDAAVRSDLRTAATAAQTYYVDHFRYPATAAGFSNDGNQPAASDGTQYTAFISQDLGAEGFVIYGLSRSGHVFELSSWNNNVPVDLGVMDFSTVRAVYGTGFPPDAAAGARRAQWAGP